MSKKNNKGSHRRRQVTNATSNHRLRQLDERRQDHLAKLIAGAESWMDPNMSEEKAVELLHALATEELSDTSGNRVFDEYVLQLKHAVARTAAEAQSRPGSAKERLAGVAQALIDGCRKQQGAGTAHFTLMNNRQLYAEWRAVHTDAKALPILANLRNIFSDPKNDPTHEELVSDWQRVKGQIFDVLDNHPEFSPCQRLSTIAGLLETDARGTAGAEQINWNHPKDENGMHVVPMRDFIKMIDGIRDDEHAQIMLSELVADAVKAKHNEGTGEDEGAFTGCRAERDEVLQIGLDEGLTKLQRLRLIKPVVSRMIPATEKRIAGLNEEIRGRKGDLERNKALAALVQSIDKAQEVGLVLQSNDCSRLHKVMEAAKTGYLVGVRHGTDSVTTTVQIKDDYIPFVVKHNWAGVLGDSEGDTNGEAMLPAPNSAFEFRISGLNVVVLCRDAVAKDGEEVASNRMVLIEAPGGWWAIINATSWSIYKFAIAQVHAACVVIEAQVATHILTQASPALNKKRLKAGKLPLYDFHTIDLSRKAKSKSERAQGPVDEPAHHKRLHFCRSHNRTYQSGRTIRVPWCLKGDPSLGWVDKQYLL